MIELSFIGGTITLLMYLEKIGKLSIDKLTLKTIIVIYLAKKLYAPILQILKSSLITY